MSGALLHIEVDDLTVEPLGVKEAVVMALEHLGGVRVLEVQIQEPEQLGMAGGAFAPSRPKPKPAPSQRGGQAPARRSPQPQTAMVCCYTCGCYRSGSGRDPGGNPYWGTCGRTGQLVRDLKERCSAWTRIGG